MRRSRSCRAAARRSRDCTEVRARAARLAELKDRIPRLERVVSRNSGNSSMPPSGDDTPGRKPPRKQRRAAERDAAKKRSRGKQPGAPGATMTWTVPDDTFDYYPEGTCACGADLGDAADLGVARSYQQKEVPEPRAADDPARPARDACARAGRPTWRPGRRASRTRRSRPGRGCGRWRSTCWSSSTSRWSGAGMLLSDVAGAEVSAGFIHSCLAKAASMAAGTVKLIKTLLIAAKVAGFDETTLRSGAAGEKKYVHGAFTERYSLFHLGTRSLETMTDFGILPDFAGIAVTDRYGNYFHATWKNISGHQACIAHILRDLQDCAEAYPGTHWPAQAREALRELIHARNQASAAAWPRSPPPPAIPSSGRFAARSPSPWPAFPASPARRTAPSSIPAGTCWSSAATAKPTS